MLDISSYIQNAQKYKHRVILLLSVVCFCGGLYFSFKIYTSLTQETTINFLNVGQGDAILITTKDRNDILIDGGPQGDILLQKLTEHLGRFDRSIDIVIATHPDLDHVQGLIPVLDKYSIGTLLISGHPSTSTVAQRFTRAYETAYNEGRLGTTTIAERGDIIRSGEFTLSILFPDRRVNQEWDTNTASVIAMINEGSSTVLLTGDAPKMIERYLITLQDFLHITKEGFQILKLGHHGSKTSTDIKLIESFKPDIAIVSARKPSKYGHPHKDVMDILKNKTIPSLHTGDVDVVCYLFAQTCSNLD